MYKKVGVYLLPEVPNEAKLRPCLWEQTKWSEWGGLGSEASWAQYETKWSVLGGRGWVLLKFATLPNVNIRLG